MLCQNKTSAEQKLKQKVLPTPQRQKSLVCLAFPVPSLLLVKLLVFFFYSVIKSPEAQCSRNGGKASSKQKKREQNKSFEGD